MWTFIIRDGMAFSDGGEILQRRASSITGSASDPDFAGLQLPLRLHRRRRRSLAGEADTLAGIEADDETMTLAVTLAFPLTFLVAGFG